MVDGSDPRSLAGSGFDLRRRCMKNLYERQDVCINTRILSRVFEREVLIEKGLNTERRVVGGCVWHQTFGLSACMFHSQFGPPEKTLPVTKLNQRIPMKPGTREPYPSGL